MTDSLHDKLADALRRVLTAQARIHGSNARKYWESEHAALAAYESAKKEPARVKLPPSYRHCNSGVLAGDEAGQWIRKDETIAALKAQGIEVIDA